MALCGVSCVYYDEGYYSYGGYPSYGAAPVYGSTVSRYSGYSSPYYPRSYGSSYYRSNSVCSRCGYNPCRCNRSSSSYYSRYGHGRHDDHDHDHDRNYSSSSRDDRNKRSDNDYRISSGSVRSSQTKPTGYHSPDWYRERGYDLNKLTLKNEEGDTYRRSSSSSSSKSKKSSSSSSSGSSSSKKKSSSSSSKSSSDRPKSRAEFVKSRKDS